MRGALFELPKEIYIFRVQIQIMKTANPTVALLLFFCALVFTHCTPDQLLASTTKEIIVQGKWAVNYYYDGQDNTAQYQNYAFSFNGDGTIGATNGTDSSYGTWSTIKDVNRNEVLTIHLHATALSGLDASWTVGSASLVSIGMKNTAGVQLVINKL